MSDWKVPTQGVRFFVVQPPCPSARVTYPTNCEEKTLHGFQYTVLIIVVLFLSVQTAHFTYMKFLYPTSSVLDEQLDDSIRSATSLEDLVQHYEESSARVEEYERTLSPEEKRRVNRRLEPYESKNKLEAAIRDWERKQKQHVRLLFQWTFGLLLTVAGTAIHLRTTSWVGSALIVAGLAEMIWWSSPGISLGGAVAEFERILNTKIILTLVTSAVFAAVWMLWRKTVRSAA